MQALPPALHTALLAALRAAGDPTPIRSIHAVGGGYINIAQRIETGQDRYFLKWNSAGAPDLFLAEARGLGLLAATQTLRVPRVLHTAPPTDSTPAYILMEWLEPSVERELHQELLGRQLASLHQAGTAVAYGLDHDNYIGSTPQLNGWEADWVVFYRERRLRPQLELARRNGLLPAARQRSLDRLLARLDTWLVGVERRPALLHGDLWIGNVLIGPAGEPALIDPAVYYGDREAELAYTELFAGFGARFYRAYHEVWPLDAGYAERRDLYNLYHLLNHLNLFGEGYGPQVDMVLRRYA